jgi:tetratricopeptide (TPR) repeat protein
MQTGDVVAERFELEHLAGKGGMGAVYRARDRQTGGAVALKILLSGGDAARFEREARVLAGLEHPAIVRYVGHGATASGERYLAMQWLEGEDLAVRLVRQALSLTESTEVVRRVAAALGAAHERGVVHRDVKPSNVLLAGGEIERAMLLDFGIARRGAEDGLGRMTGTGSFLGTPGYLAPEQARGDRGLDARADVFSLGCVLFECVAGRPAFEGEHVLALLAKILMEEAPRLGSVCDGVPAALDDLVARMLSKSAAERPRDGAEVERLLGAIPLCDDPGSRVAPRAPAAEITTGEQRFMAVVLAAAEPVAEDAALSVDAPTLPAVTGQLEALRRAVARFYQANVEPLAGGGFVAMLGGTSIGTDDADQAARCALAMRALLPAATLGLVTARAVVGTSLPLGAALEDAARLMRESTGGVRLDAATAALLTARFDVVETNGRWELRGERDAAEPVRTLMGRATPCFGRARELALCEAMFDECVSESVARAVVVTAAAGVGKSRLRYEVLRSLHARGEPLEVWIGRGDAASAGSPFGMIGPALRRAAGVLDGAPIEEQRAKFAERFGRHLAEDRRARVVAFVGELAGVPFDDDATEHLSSARKDAIVLGDQMMLAWLDLLEAETRAHPLLLVLEDLHRGDYPSVRFVDSALREHRERPLMVLALARPEVEELFPKLWRERSAHELRLEGIGKRAGEQLVRAVLGANVDAAAVTKLVEHAAGNAFYLEELIRAYGEGRTDLPESVLTMVEARLLALDAEDRRLLRAASVLGERCWRGAIQTLLGGESHARDLDARLAALCAQNLLEARPDARFAGEREYVFRHSIVREAAYGMLLDADRVLGHRLAAVWLEAAGEHDAVVIAEHFEKGGERARAAAQWLRAAQDALAGNDFEVAVRHAERGCACTSEGSVIGALLLVQVEAHAWVGNLRGERDAAAMALGAVQENSTAWYEAASHIISASFNLGDVERMLELVDRVMELAPSAADTATAARVLASLAAPLHVLGDFARGEAAVRAMERAVRQLPEVPLGVARAVHMMQGVIGLVSGDLVAFFEGREAAAACHERAGNVRGACFERGAAAYGFRELGCYAEAEARMSASKTDAERMGLHIVANMNRHYLGPVLARQGRLEEARREELLALEAFLAQGDADAATAHAYLARIALISGDLDAAERHARAGSHADVIPVGRPMALAELANVLLARGQSSDARAAAAEATALLASRGTFHEGEALVRLMEAETLEAIGDHAAACVAIHVARARLLERAAKISREDYRRSFLENVSENARTLEFAKAWLDDA